MFLNIETILLRLTPTLAYSVLRKQLKVLSKRLGELPCMAIGEFGCARSIIDVHFNFSNICQSLWKSGSTS